MIQLFDVLFEGYFFSVLINSMNETPGIGVLSVTGRETKIREKLTIIARLFVLHTHILPPDAPYRHSPSNKTIYRRSSGYRAHPNCVSNHVFDLESPSASMYLCNFITSKSSQV